MSSRMMSLVGAYAPRQEVYSIDESFLDFTGVPGDLAAICRAMRARVLQWTGLPTSVGIGPTKTLAKLANHVAKMAERKPGCYDGRFAQVCHLGAVSPADLQAVFHATPVGDVWGIGRRLSARLNAGGIHSVADLVGADLAALRRQFSVVLEKTVLELRGTACMEVDHEPAPQQQMMCSRSFGAAVTTLPELVEVVSQFATRVADKARRQAAAAGAVHVFITTSPHRQTDRQHSPGITVPLLRPSADTRVIVAAAVQAVGQMFRTGFRYAKAGVMLVDLQPQALRQGELDLFGPTVPGPAGAGVESHPADGRRRHPEPPLWPGAVAVASAQHQQRHGQHAGRQLRRSPRFTTRLDEIATAHA